MHMTIFFVWRTCSAACLALVVIAPACFATLLAPVGAVVWNRATPPKPVAFATIDLGPMLVTTFRRTSNSFGIRWVNPELVTANGAKLAQLVRPVGVITPLTNLRKSFRVAFLGAIVATTMSNLGFLNLVFFATCLAGACYQALALTTLPLTVAFSATKNMVKDMAIATTKLTMAPFALKLSRILKVVVHHQFSGVDATKFVQTFIGACLAFPVSAFDGECLLTDDAFLFLGFRFPVLSNSDTLAGAEALQPLAFTDLAFERFATYFTRTIAALAAQCSKTIFGFECFLAIRAGFGEHRDLLTGNDRFSGASGGQAPELSACDQHAQAHC